jgi:hypothetical protein
MKKAVENTATDKLIKRVLLLENLTELKAYKAKIKRKKELFDEVKDYCERYVPMQDLKQFNESFTEYFKKSFIKKYRSQFPSIVSDLKMFEMSDVQLSKIEFYETKYKDIEVEDFDYLQGKAKFIDFGMYAETPEQIERYYSTINLILHLNNLKENFEQGTIIKQHIAKAIRVISFDQLSNNFKVNVNYILNGFQ